MINRSSVGKEIGQISALDESHTQVRLITIKRWFAISLFLFFALVAIYWACTGYIPVTSEGRCVILDQNGNTRILGFFSLLQAESIHPDMEALIAIDGMTQAQFGTIRARVMRISPYPVSANSQSLSLIPSEVLRKFLTGGKVPKVLVELEAVSSSTGFEWTSNAVPPHQISSGSLGVVQIILKKVRPISYVIPEA